VPLTPHAQKHMDIAYYVRDDSAFEQAQVVLARAGFSCHRFSSDTALLRALPRRTFGVILIDIGTQFREAAGIFSWLACRSGDATPVLVLSSTHNAEWVAEALNAGADDFLTRPYEPIELIARIQAIGRRSKPQQLRRTLIVGEFALERNNNRFYYQGKPEELTPREFTMAWLLFSSPGVYVPRDTISTAIWGIGSDIAGRTIEQHIYKLRKKMQLGAERGVQIRTAYNRGYRIELSGPADTAPAAGT
jgi:DNA-binding response OmpR family regulator